MSVRAAERGTPTGARRTPSLVFGGVSILIVILMLTALNQAQPPPPPTAEYAPEAVQALKEAPKEQTSQAGSGEEGTGGVGVAATTTTTAAPKPGDPGVKVIETKNVRRCIGNPPRQIEDTQSPPCVGYFDGDNGGATWKGVTANEIRIAVPAEYQQNLIPRFESFFNKRFEFYGRHIKFVGVGGCGGKHPSDMKGCATSANAQNVFGSLSYQDVGGNQEYYYDELARLGIVSVASHPDRRTEEHLAANAPYEWMYLPSFDKQHRHLASYVCRQLAGKTANHAGGASALANRKFGLVTNTYTDAPEGDFSGLVNGLKGCGVELVRAQVEFEYGDRQDTGYQNKNATTTQQSANAMIQMNNQNVTTVMCICHSSTTAQLTTAADAQGYQPEWIVTTYAYHSGNLFWSQQPQTQAAHAIVLEFHNKQVAVQNEPWYWATQEVDPAFDYEKNPFVFLGAYFLYHQILLMASGLQMAGPNLTPEAFQAGLWNSKFPNPESPWFEGKVGFEDRDHSFVNDATIEWWDPSGRDPWMGTQGAFCYVRFGQRNSIGNYPQRDEVYSSPTCPG